MATPEIKAVINIGGVQSEHLITPTFSDMVKYDVLRNRKNLPGREQAEFLFMGIVAYVALVRLGAVPSTLDVMEFMDKNLVSLDAVEAASEEAAEFPAE